MIKTLEDKKRFGLREGDIIQTNDTHNRQLTTCAPIKDGVILFIENGLACVDLGNGERTYINCYWLKKADFFLADKNSGEGK